MRTAEIFTDGACARNGQPDASMGIGVFWHLPFMPERNISEPYHANRRTNQLAELEAVRRGISECKKFGYQKVIISTDSRYAINGVKNYLNRWRENGYCNSKGYPIANAKAFQDIYSTMVGIRVQFRHVQSRDNYADRLAKDGSRGFSCSKSNSMY